MDCQRLCLPHFTLWYPQQAEAHIQFSDINRPAYLGTSPDKVRAQHSDNCACLKDEPSCSLNRGCILLEGSAEMGTMFVSCVWCNKSPQTWGLEIADVCFLTVQVARSLKLTCWFLLGIQGRTYP